MADTACNLTLVLDYTWYFPYSQNLKSMEMNVSFHAEKLVHNQLGIKLGFL
jgi:hypothetical protein